MNVKIIPAKEKDMPTCTKILEEEFSKQGENWNPKTAKTRLKELLEDNPGLCFCIKQKDKIIGFVFAEEFNYVKGRYLWVSEIAIKASHQGKGIGTKALEFMEKLARKKKFDVITLATNKKQRAIRLYKRKGFKETGFVFLEKEIN